MTLKDANEENSGIYLCSVSELSGIGSDNYATSSLDVITSPYQKLLTLTAVNSANSQSLLQTVSLTDDQVNINSTDKGFILIIAITVGVGSLLIITCSIMYIVVRQSDDDQTIDTTTIKTGSNQRVNNKNSSTQSSPSSGQFTCTKSSRIQSSSNDYSRKCNLQSSKNRRLEI